MCIEEVSLYIIADYIRSGKIDIVKLRALIYAVLLLLVLDVCFKTLVLI